MSRSTRDLPKASPHQLSSHYDNVQPEWWPASPPVNIMMRRPQSQNEATMNNTGPWTWGLLVLVKQIYRGRGCGSAGGAESHCSSRHLRPPPPKYVPPPHTGKAEHVNLLSLLSISYRLGLLLCIMGVTRPPEQTQIYFVHCHTIKYKSIFVLFFPFFRSTDASSTESLLLL